MDGNQAQQRIEQLEDFVAQCADYFRRLPLAPANQAMAERCAAVLADRPAGAVLMGRTFSPSGLPALDVRVDLARRCARVALPPPMGERNPAVARHVESHVLALLRQGTELGLKPLEARTALFAL